MIYFLFGQLFYLSDRIFPSLKFSVKALWPTCLLNGKTFKVKCACVYWPAYGWFKWTCYQDRQEDWIAWWRVRPRQHWIIQPESGAMNEPCAAVWAIHAMGSGYQPHQTQCGIIQAEVKIEKYSRRTQCSCARIMSGTQWIPFHAIRSFTHSNKHRDA